MDLILHPNSTFGTLKIQSKEKISEAGISKSQIGFISKYWEQPTIRA